MMRLVGSCCTAEVYNMVILPNVAFPLQHPQCWKGLQPESQPSPQASVSSAPLSAQQVSSFAGRTSMHAAWTVDSSRTTRANKNASIFICTKSTYSLAKRQEALNQRQGIMKVYLIRTYEGLNQKNATK